MRQLACLPFVLLLAAASARADDVFQMPEGLRSLEFVEVGDPGNAADDTGFGAVAYPFRIGKTEVTAAQWVVFLNAKAKADRDGGLWNNDMDTTRSGEGVRCDIRREGEAGSFVHRVAPEKANRPVTHVSFLDACRFCNWLHNGQGDGDTETGAYTLNGYWGTDGRGIRRNPDARFFVPNEDEWYKAAYFDPKKPGGAGYWDYPTRSDTKPRHGFDSENAANFWDAGLLDATHCFTEAGAFSRSLSACGTLDQAGNAAEWTEALQPPFLRGLRGGAFDTEDAGLNIPLPNRSFTSISDVPNVGIRVAATVPGATPPFPEAPAINLAAASAVADFPRRPWRDPLTGKPFFPLAWFSYESDEADLDAIASEGGNLVLYVNSPCDLDSDDQLAENVPRLLKYLDHAQERSVRVLVQAGGWYGAHTRGDSAEIERQRQFITAIREHPALFGYQLYDEPEYARGDGLGVTDRKGIAEFVEGFRRTREALRKWDPNPNRMISVVFNLVPLSSWTDYLPVVDSFQVDRYPLDRDQAYFGHRGDWGPLMMAWSMAHGADALRDHPHLRNPAPCMQGVGSNHTESGMLGVWRNPLYEETRYMAYSSLTVGSWGVFHWIRKFGHPESPVILENVARLHRELRSLMPALEQSYETPPFTVRHNHENITRGFLTDSVADITTLALADDQNYYLVVSDNSGTFADVSLGLTGLDLGGADSVEATALNEAWSRRLSYSEDQGEWILDTHTMCFGDINVWVIPKRQAAE